MTFKWGKNLDKDINTLKKLVAAPTKVPRDTMEQPKYKQQKQLQLSPRLLQWLMGEASSYQFLPEAQTPNLFRLILEFRSN
jgi:hypothetical protein